MVPSLRDVSFATHMILPQNVSNKYALVGRVKIEDRFEFVSHLLHYRSPDLNHEFATYSEVGVTATAARRPACRNDVARAVPVSQDYNCYILVIITSPPR